MTTLHTLHDGSKVRIIGAKELIMIPVWHGNRIIDSKHVQRIKEGLGKNIQKLDFGYRIVRYLEKDAGGNSIPVSCIIDGQHRHKVLCDYFNESLCEPDFPVVVLETNVECETDIITCFKELNNQMPILWKSDPNMLANEYIKELTAAFNTKKELFIRPKTTTRPYLSVEKIRQVLVAHGDSLKESQDEINGFVKRAIEYNADLIKNSALNIIHAKKEQGEFIQKAANVKFMLALDPKLPWIALCLRVF